MFKILFLVVLIGALVPASDAQCTAPRVRRAWRNLARAEQELYVEAVLLLKQRGTYDQFVNMHTSTQTVDYAHGASGFLPWHRWFLYQFENALRALGPRYQCLTVPYWDWERESSTRRRSSILGDLFGTYMTNAPADTGRCVTDGRFTLPTWRTTDGQCLLRAFDDGPGGMGFAGESEVAGYITRVTQYGSAEAGFRGTMEGLLHGAPHVWVGGNMGAFGSPNDPVFFLHHSNVDRIWALWQDCHDYDRVDYNAATIRNQIYPWFQTSNTPGIRDGPVDPMPFTHSDGRRDERYYTGLPTGQNAPLPLDMMRIMGNRRVTSMSYAYDPADSLKGLLDRTGARCNWNWFIVPNAVLPAPSTPTPPANPTPNTTTPARAVCGNGIVETGEQCDEPARTCGTCVNCRLLCGNGVVDCGEDCDDGNRVNGDSCPATCRRAHAWRRIRSDLSLKRDGTLSTEYDAETLAYMNGEISWEDYMFPAGKRSAEQGRKGVYSSFRVKGDNSTTPGNSSFPSLRLRSTGGPMSGYLIFGKAPEPPKNWANPLMEKLGSSVCEHNPMTKFAHAKAKLEMLTYVEAEMEGCRKRANEKWIAMTKMNATKFQPPCKGTFCCKVADMVSEKMVCDGGTVAVPSCNVSTCTWSYDCGNATVAHDEDEPKNATRPRSVYYRAAAIGSEGQSYDGNSNGNSVGISDTAKIGLGVGGGVLLLAILIVGIVIVTKGKTTETA